MKLPANTFRIAILLIIIIGLIKICIIACDVYAPLKSEQIVLHVAKGDNASTIAAKLKDSGIIRSKMLFKTLATLRGTDRRLIAGTYSLGGNHNLFQTLMLLEKGNTSAVRITFPEGLSLYKTLQKIDRSGLASYAELNQAATDTVFVRQLTGFAVPSLEGFLYPETYAFDISVTPRDILKQMTAMFFSKLSSAKLDPKAIPEFYSKLILASIVEKESGGPEERDIIAGVLTNRMRKGMNISSCPTVDYVLEKQGIKRDVLTLADTRIQSPYNTYVNKGLPPGPICNPALPSIQAALQPAKTDYLFFVADRKGHNDFSVTGEEHLNKVKHYRRSEWQ